MSPVSWQTKKTVSFFFLLLAMLDHYLKESAIPFVRIRLPWVATRLREPQSIGNSWLHRLDQTDRFLRESPRVGGLRGFSFSIRLMAFCLCGLASLELIDGSRNASNRKVGGTDCERCHAPIEDNTPKEWISWIKFVIRLRFFLPARPGPFWS